MDCSGTVTLTEPLRFSTVTLLRGGALVTSTEPLRLVTETSPATRSRVMLRLCVVRVRGPTASLVERSALVLMSIWPSRRASWKSVRLVWNLMGPRMRSKWAVAEELAAHGERGR